MANGGPGVVIVESGGLPVTQVTGGGNASPFTVVTGNGFPVTLVDTLGIAVALYNLDGTEYSGVSLPAPVLTLITGADDNTPLWGFDLVNPLEGDVIRLEWDDAIPYVAQVSFSDYTLTAGDLSGDFEFDFGLAPYADGAWSWRSYHMRGAATSAVSNTVTETIVTASPFDVSFLGTNTQTNDASTYTITAATFGVADAGRKIAIAFLGAGNVTVSSVTIGGVTASAVSGAVATQPSSSRAYIYEAAVPTGTSGDIVITFSGTAVRLGAAWWRVVSGTSSSGNGAIGTGVNTLPITITIPTGGVGIYFAYQFIDANFNAWTNLTTEDFDTAVETSRAMSGGRRTVAGSTAVTANWPNATSNNPNLVACAYGP